jgi:hypothetical protein
MAGGAEPTIGIVGPHELVERIMLSGLPLTAGPGLAQPSERGDTATRRLVTAAYREEQEAPEKVARLGSTVDACLFASRVPYEYARRAGVLTVPATYIQLSGSALYAAMLRASREGLDIARSSIDVVSQADAEDAFSELGISAGGVRVREEVSGAAIIAAFHERLWHQEETAVAFTCLGGAWTRPTAQVPVFQLRPTGSAIRSALRTGTLLAGYRRLENAQLAVVIVEVPTLRDTVRRGAPRQAREELRLTVHRFLVQEAQRIHATVSALNEHGFLVVATRGSLSQAADGLGGPPFVERARSELGIGIEVGVGGGRTELEAEARARASLGRPATAARMPGQARDRVGQPLVPGPRAATAAASGRGLDTLVRLAEKLSATGATPVVDAETAGRLLSVTPRTARRLLATLVEEGLAWPLPPSRSPQPGRPRQAYRLVVEKLGPRSVR